MRFLFYKLTRVALFIFIFVLAGCMGTNWKKSADKSYESGDYRKAYYDYQNAIKEDPEILEDPEIKSRVWQSELNMNLASARDSKKNNDWLNALDDYQKVLGIDAGNPEAIQQIPLMKNKLCVSYLDKAVDAAVQGYKDEAERMVGLAVEADPLNTLGNRASAIIKSDDSVSSKDLEQLVKESEEQVALFTYNIPARINIYKANLQMKKARAVYDEALKADQEGKFRRSHELASEALKIWPHHSESQTLRDRSKSKIDEVDRLADVFTKLIQDKKWDDAKAVIGKISSMDRELSLAYNMTNELEEKASDYHLQLGREYKSNNDFTKAEREFRKALTFKDEWKVAKQEIVLLRLVKSELLVKQGKTGEAFLTLQALKYTGITTYRLDDEIELLEGKILNSISVPVEITVSSSGGTKPLEADMQSRLEAALKKSGRSVLKSSYGEEKAYVLKVDLEHVDTKKDTLMYGAKRKRYIDVKKVKNPKHEYMERELDRENERLRDLDRKRRTVCYHCRGTGREKCSTCSGAGNIPCKVCPVKTGTKTTASRCSTCNNTKSITCSRCKSGKQVCRTCSGTGNRYHIRSSEISTLKRDVRKLKREYDKTPRYIEKKMERYWRYNYRKEAVETKLFLNLELLNSDSESIRQKSKTYIIKEADDAIDNPNRRIGLRENMMVLPSESEMERRVTKGAAADIFKIAFKEIISAEIRNRQERGLGSLEVQVESLLLLKKIDYRSHLTEEKKLLQRIK